MSSFSPSISVAYTLLYLHRHSNQTNLALKGIIGIEAMSVISRLTGNEADSANYTAIAHDFIDKWQTLGIAHDADPPHTTLSYGENDTHGKLYRQREVIVVY